MAKSLRPNDAEAEMFYNSSDDWKAARNKRVLFFGMSGLGKTHLSNILRETGDWFHYSVDYRIGTRYMGEHIVDNCKHEAMRSPFLSSLLKSDSIYISSNITFNNLAPLSTYLGKPGDPEKGGIPIAEYHRRQEQHRVAETQALLDTPHFVRKAQGIYAYPNFVCDSGGSICEVVDPANARDPVLKALSDNMLLVQIKGGEDHADELVRRFDKAPKPMYFGPTFLDQLWTSFCNDNNCVEADVDPDAFMRFAYRQTLDHRMPRYQAMADNWGISVDARDVASIRDSVDLDAMMTRALSAQ